MKNNKKGIFFAILSAILLSFSYIFFTVLLKGEAISQILFYWFLIALIFSLLFGIKKRKQIFKELKNNLNQLIFLGISEGLAAIFFLTSLKILGPSLTAFLVQFVFIFVLLYSLIFLKEKFNLFEFFGIILAIGGVLIINLNQEVYIIKGSFLILIAALLFATSSFIAKKSIKKVSSKTINLIRLFFISLFGLGYLLIQNENFIISLSNLWLIIIGSFFCAFLGFELFYNSLKYIELATSNTLRTLSPLFTLLFAFVILSEIPTLTKIIGGFLILVGVLILIKNVKNKNNNL